MAARFLMDIAKNNQRLNNVHMGGSTGGLVSAAVLAASIPFAATPYFGRSSHVLASAYNCGHGRLKNYGDKLANRSSGRSAPVWLETGDALNIPKLCHINDWIASCDAGPTSPILAEDYLTGLRTMSETILRHDTLDYLTKEYSIELKPLFSAFQMKSLGLTIIRSFSLYYLPLLQPKVEDDDNDFLPDDERPVDLIEPFKKSVKQILCE
ncbi:hypothetical protein Tco_1083671, partial [Tanacetum coccineum]